MRWTHCTDTQTVQPPCPSKNSLQDCTQQPRTVSQAGAWVALRCWLGFFVNSWIGDCFWLVFSCLDPPSCSRCEKGRCCGRTSEICVIPRLWAAFAQAGGEHLIREFCLFNSCTSVNFPPSTLTVVGRLLFFFFLERTKNPLKCSKGYSLKRSQVAVFKVYYAHCGILQRFLNYFYSRMLTTSILADGAIQTCMLCIHLKLSCGWWFFFFP